MVIFSMLKKVILVSNEIHIWVIHKVHFYKKRWVVPKNFYWVQTVETWLLNFGKTLGLPGLPIPLIFITDKNLSNLLYYMALMS